MSVSPARSVAYRVLRQVESGRRFGEDLLRAPAVSALSAADRNLVQELVLGALRRRAELDQWIERLSGKPLAYFDPEVVTILRLGIYQVRWLDRVPKSAAVNEAVDMTKAARKRSAAGLVNAVLRKCEAAKRTRAGLLADDGSLRLALPTWLAERWTRRFGAEAEAALARWSLEPPRAVVRVAGGMSREEAAQTLAGEGISSKPARYASRALVVEHGSITQSKLWRARQLTIQDEASQLVGSLLEPKPRQQVLDLCAAPGMKTAQLAEDLGCGLLIACDRSARRLRSMKALLDGLIPPGVRWHRVELDATRPLPFSVRFDRILLDAPCSGTGTLARNPEIKWRLGLGDIVRLAEMQAKMLAAALDALAPNGRLVYATCSLEPEENEEVVERILAEKRRFRCFSQAELRSERPDLAPLFDERGYFRTRPDLHETDGFFATVVGWQQIQRDICR
jgi:16S rRNA (cytosine967-C5)-methyltransferase